MELFRKRKEEEVDPGDINTRYCNGKRKEEEVDPGEGNVKNHLSLPCEMMPQTEK